MKLSGKVQQKLNSVYKTFSPEDIRRQKAFEKSIRDAQERKETEIELCYQQQFRRNRHGKNQRRTNSSF